jgi:ankyrin repeat protein
LTDFGYTNLHRQIVLAKGNVDHDNWTHLHDSDILGWTPLHYAVIYAPGIVSKIFKDKCDSETGKGDEQRLLASSPDSAGRIPLHYAVIQESPTAVDLVKELLKAYGKADSGNDGILPLHLAAKHGKEHVAKALLENQSHQDKISAGDYWGMTPLHFAANEDQVHIVKLLLSKEAKIDAQDKLERTALHIAVEKIKAYSVEALLGGDDAGRVTKLKDKNGETALQIAARLGRSLEDRLAKVKSSEESVEQKKRNGDIPKKTSDDKVSKQKRPKEDLSKELADLVRSKTKLERELEHLKKIIELLLGKENLAVDGGQLLIWSAKERLNTTFSVLMDKGARNDEIDASTGQSVLHIAAMVGSEDMVQLILNKWTKKDVSELKKKIDMKDDTETTALISAVIGGCSKIVDLLLNAGADQTAVDAYQRTALSWAVENNQLAIVKRLLDTGNTACVDLDVVDGDPPRLLLSRAAKNGNLAIVKVLCGKGAKVGLKNILTRTPINWAVTNGDHDLVEFFLEASPKPDIDEISAESDFTLLAEAINADELDIAERLLKAGANVNKKIGTSEHTPLSFAAALGRLSFIDLLLKSGAATEEVDSDGWTPLMFAVQGKFLKAVKLLLSKGSRASVSHDGKNSALSLAIASDSDEMVYEILKDAHGEQPQEHLDHALLWAAKRGSTPVVALLLEREASVYARRPNGSTPLLRAAKRGYLDIVKVLLESKTDGNLANNEGETPLYWASNKGYQDVVNALLGKSEHQIQVDINVSTNYKDTALLTAASEGHEAVALSLIEFGADVHVRNNYQETTLYWACHNGNTALVKKCLEMKADPSITTIYDATPLLEVVKTPRPDIVKLLLQENPELDVPKLDIDSALNLASYVGSKEILELLLDHDANIESTDRHGDTPLHQCSYRGNLEIANLLLDKGAKCDAKNREGRTPLHYAAWKGHLDLMTLLYEKDNNIVVGNNKADEADNKGRTPLSLASAGGQNALDSVDFLIRKFMTNKESKDENGRTPISWAASDGDGEIIDFSICWMLILILGTIMDGPRYLGQLQTAIFRLSIYCWDIMPRWNIKIKTVAHHYLGPHLVAMKMS